MEDFNFQVDLKGLITLLSDHLYSSDDVFIRELLQNGVDAIAARKQIEKDFIDGIITVEYIEEKPDIQIIFRDNGIGLEEEELHQFLAVIGQSSKRGEKARETFIGQFGIGLLSCFLAADEIEVTTCSLKDKTSHRWIGHSDGTYNVIDVPSYQEIGSEVRLRLKKEVISKFNRSSICHILSSYGFLLPIPIEFHYKGKTTLINDVPIPWRQDFYTKGDIMEFGKLVFEEEFLDATLLEGEGLHGYAYISAKPLPAGQTTSHRIYLHSMFLTTDGKDLIPKWASFARCLVDVQDLTPTASREGLQRDGKLFRARSTIEKCLLNYLTELTKFDLTKMKQLASIHNLAFKAFALENDKILKLLFPFLIFSTNKGDLTGAQILDAVKKRPVFYCVDVDSYRRVSPLLEYSNTLLINGGYVYETDILNQIIKANPKLPLKLFEDSLFDQLFENPGEKEEMAFETFRLEAQKQLKAFRCKPVMKRLSPPELPSLFVEGADFFLSDELQTDFDEFSFLDGFENFGNLVSNDDQLSTLYLNCDNSLIQNLSKVSNPTLLQAAAKVLYVQARLAGHYPASAQELDELSSGLSEIVAFGLGG